MDALEFLMERNRLCGSYRGCVGCPFGAADCVVRDMTSEHTCKRIVTAVEQWSMRGTGGLTMAEYIRREDVIEWFMPYAHAEESIDADVVISDIKGMKAADVAPVRHGRWEPGNPICPVCGGDKFKDLDADIWCDWLPNYCPNCGAKMDGGDK